MTNLLISCLVPIMLTPTTLTEYKQCRTTEVKLYHVQEYQQVVELYFQPQDVNKALLIIFCESSGRRGITNTNKNGTTDKGIFQFNDLTWAWLQDKLKFEGDRFNVELSTRIASWLAYNDGFHHWNSSKHCWDV